MESILLINDDEALRVALWLALERAGYSVLVARDGREGLQLFRGLPPDLVITDIVMEGQEGLETIQSLRREVPGVKIIAMSGGGLRGDLPFSMSPSSSVHRRRWANHSTFRICLPPCARCCTQRQAALTRFKGWRIMVGSQGAWSCRVIRMMLCSAVASLIQKPFSPDALAITVHQILNTSAVQRNDQKCPHTVQQPWLDILHKKAKMWTGTMAKSIFVRTLIVAERMNDHV